MAKAEAVIAQLGGRAHRGQDSATHDPRPTTDDTGLYVIPLAYRKRTLFKMDLAEAVYISELRTAPAGHFSYRQIAWRMYQAVAERHPHLAALFRVQDPSDPWDLLQR
jgi:hypothetical protein